VRCRNGASNSASASISDEGIVTKVQRFTAITAIALAGAGLAAQGTLDYAVLARIQDEGLNRSQVMDHVGWLSDVAGPRLTGSPGFKQAADWAVKRLADWGLANAKTEKWKFGKGWSLTHFQAHLVEPQRQPMIGYPKAWTPSTKGTVTADVMRVAIGSDADFEKYRGKLAGKIVLSQPARDVRMLEGRITWRMGEEMLNEAERLPIPAPNAPRPAAPPSGPSLAEKALQFYLSEGVAAVLDRGSDQSTVPMGGNENLSPMTQRVDGGTIFVQAGGPRDENAGKVPPQITLAVEHYNRLVRLLDRGVPVKMEIDVQAQFHDETDMNGLNVVAEIPGSDLANEIVLIGAHLDSWHSSNGATDNGAGVAVMMETMRILKAVGAKPRRTIRIALWGGEEQGYLGSRGYVQEHLGDAAKPKAEYQRLAAYYNLDNGTGRIRGIWMQGNVAITPIFAQWIEPLRGLGVTVLAPRSTSGSDYVPFDEIGIPAFQFIQDRLEYNSRTHHSNMDTFDRVQRDDLVQMSIVLANFAYNTSMHDKLLPRKVMPTAAGTRPTQE
jgi:carboxypeptidase Q